MSLSPNTIDIIKATAAPVSQHAEAITIRMYTILFEKHPETELLFKDADADQHKKLAAAIAAYAVNIDNLAVLEKAVEKITKSHFDSKIMPEHYPMVGVSLLEAVKDVLGDTATDEVIEAWREAFFFLADLLIATEKKLYAAA